MSASLGWRLLAGAAIGGVLVVAIFGSHVTDFNASAGTIVGIGLAYDLISQPERAAAALAEPAQGTAGDIAGRRVVPEERPAEAGRGITSERRTPDGG